jgi:hypothetical protein
LILIFAEVSIFIPHPSPLWMEELVIDDASVEAPSNLKAAL